MFDCPPFLWRANGVKKKVKAKIYFELYGESLASRGVCLHPLSSQPCSPSTSLHVHTAMGLYLLDYGAGNVRSLANTLTKLGYEFKWISSPDDFAKASVRVNVRVSQLDVWVS